MNQVKRIKNQRAEWLVPTGLILLSLIPVVGGAFRLASLAGGPDITQDSARFFASPVPVALHVISAVLYALLGAFQFMPAFRARNPKWHRRSGKVLVVAGLIVALSGLWMTVFYPIPEALQGTLLYGFRLAMSSLMFVAIVLACTAIYKRDIPSHRAWMIRAYAVAQGAGTQSLVFIALLPFITLNPALGNITGLPRDLLMILAWLINLSVAEWIIHKQIAVVTRATSVSVS